MLGLSAVGSGRREPKCTGPPVRAGEGCRAVRGRRNGPSPGTGPRRGGAASGVHHFPIGHFWLATHAFHWPKHPHFVHRPCPWSKCSHAWQIARRRACSSDGEPGQRHGAAPSLWLRRPGSLLLLLGSLPLIPGALGLHASLGVPVALGQLFHGRPPLEVRMSRETDGP